MKASRLYLSWQETYVQDSANIAIDKQIMKEKRARYVLLYEKNDITDLCDCDFNRGGGFLAIDY